MIPNQLVVKIVWSRECGQILKAYRKAAKLSQKDIAEKANISRQLYSDLETGKNQQSLSYQMLQQFCLILNVDENLFFNQCLKSL